MPTAAKPIILVTGALGAGKTSGLGTLVTHYGFSSPQVLINDVGQENDEVRFESVSGSASALTLGGGCACCERSEQFADALVTLLDRSPTLFDLILFEASGVADPASIMRLISEHPKLTHHLQVHSLVHYVDATFLPSVRTQDIALADVCVIAKSDLVAPREVDEIAAEVRRTNPLITVLLQEVVDECPLITACPSSFEASGQPQASWVEPPLSERQMMRVADFRLPAGMSWLALATWATALLSRHGDRILRLKASVPARGRRIVLNGVRHTLFSPKTLDLVSPSDTPGTLTIIGSSIDTEVILSSVQTFVDAGIELSDSSRDVRSDRPHQGI